MEIEKIRMISPRTHLLTRRRLLAGAAGIAAAGMIRPAGAVLRLEVTEGNVQPVPIAIPDFLGGSPADSELARSISQVITADLRRSGLFAPIDPAAYIEKIANADAVPRFADWRVINAQALVTGPRERRVKRLAIMDQDGAAVRYLTRGEDLVLTPRFNPSTQEITYMSYGQGDPRVYLLNIETGQREIVGNFPGMSFSPRFSPDGQRVIMSLQQGSNSNLFVMDLRSKTMTRLTDTPAIDTAPCYSPNGAQICFESDRGGTQQIYIMAAGGGAAQRISFGNGSYSTPVWSPRGDAIAFTKREQGSFGIGVMKPDGSGERLLTEGFHNEGPTWAPNGRVLMFFRDPGSNSGAALFTIDLTGRNEQRIPTPSHASDPAWSPLLS